MAAIKDYSTTLPSVFDTTTVAGGPLPGMTTNMQANPQWDELLGAATKDLYDAKGIATADQYDAQGNLIAAQGYNEAASIAGGNVGLEEQSVALQQTQAARAAYQTIGAETAGVAGAGLQQSGSAMDLLRSSVSQANLTQKTIALQGQINENAYSQQQQAFLAEAGVAQNAAQGETQGAQIAEQGGNAALKIVTNQAQTMVPPPGFDPSTQRPTLAGVVG